ncbi:hypothetical protein [Parageobacillus thermoglucosidasius]|uniref:hypothetical protein n=1 Tax=Parageobacillus thermoglucosidasius TaxID=1426 RepID=UPI0001D18496|nr:hypothetical protein [Parageobacillus thermoglucosidasius]AEH49503.1 hypothetical protein Geoth_3673 [Parageobacillus thermoglucosidasius C56-YS93]
MRVTEENVVQQLKLKNEESISYVLETYGGLLHAIIRKYLQGNELDVEECLADVLYKCNLEIQPPYNIGSLGDTAPTKPDGKGAEHNQ